jgi:GNAT superfamily N-acetyltransferase
VGVSNGRVQVRVADSGDLAWLTGLDPVDPAELASVVERGRILVAEQPDASDLVGFLRWGLFWDHVPMMNLLLVVPLARGNGVGRALVAEWERVCATAGHATVLTSTQADESAQHFYRRLGYREAGSLIYPGQAIELFFSKKIG